MQGISGFFQQQSPQNLHDYLQIVNNVINFCLLFAILQVIILILIHEFWRLLCASSL